MIDDRLTQLLNSMAAATTAVRARVPLVLHDPRSYPREAMVLAMIAVLGVILLLTLVFIIQEQVVTTRKRADLKVARDVNRLLRTMVWWASGVIVATMIIAALPLVPALDGACGSCHVTSVPVRAWEDGTHSHVSCYACHAAPGFLGALSAGASGADHVVSVFRGEKPSGASATLYSGQCLDCHTSVAQGVTGEGVRMRHSDVIEARLPCAQCHSAVGHEAGNSTRARTQSPDQVMAICLTCHDDVKASAECDVCHGDHPLDAATTPANPGSTDMQMSCVGCHRASTQAACIECHGLELPHPREFFSRHAALSSDDPALCAKCHELASADEGCACHSEVNVHGTYSEWFPRHGAMAAETGPLGCNCHEVAFCGVCHPRSPFAP